VFRFDVLVNGGGAVTLQFQRSPFHPLTRTVFVPWNQIVVLPPVAMQLSDDTDIYRGTGGNSLPYGNVTYQNILKECCMIFFFKLQIELHEMLSKSKICLCLLIIFWKHTVSVKVFLFTYNWSIRLNWQMFWVNNIKCKNHHLSQEFVILGVQLKPLYSDAGKPAP